MELIVGFNNFSDGLDFFAKGRIPYIANTSLPCQKKGGRKKGGNTTTIRPPYDVVAKSNGEPGGVRLSYKIDNAQKNLVLMVALEWSVDGGKTWNNGKYPTETRIELEGMPSHQTILIRLCALASSQRKSVWTTPVEVSVL